MRTLEDHMASNQERYEAFAAATAERSEEQSQTNASEAERRQTAYDAFAAATAPKPQGS